MKFKLGDFVRFVDEKREGYVTKVIDPVTLGVTDTDGFEIPVHIGNLTHVHGQFTEVKNDENSANNTISAHNFAEPGIYLYLSEDKKANGVVHFHLVNNTAAIAMASFISQKNSVFKGEFVGTISSAGMSKIYAAALPDLSNWPELNLQLLLHNNNSAPVPPLKFIKKFKAKDFEAKKIVLAGLEDLGWKIRLDEDDFVIDPQKLKESFFKQSAPQQILALPASEIDLHIEVLRDDHLFMQSAEILKDQMAHFEKNLEAAIVHRLPSIIFIHGVGSGILQHQIHKYLSKHQQVRTFKDARKEKFGYGATEVFFK